MQLGGAPNRCFLLPPHIIGASVAIIIASLELVCPLLLNYNNAVQVGASYGRRMMTGLLLSQGIRVCQLRVGQSLQRVNPGYHRSRRTRAHRLTNPVSYRAEYFGEKLHIDQNEKLVMFGVTHICAVDGYSGKIVAFSTMPVKNNIVIYKSVYM